MRQVANPNPSPNNETMKRQLTAAVLGLLLGSAAITACKSLGTPEDQSEATTLWDEMSGYQSWGGFDGHVGIMKGKSPHGKYVHTYVNEIGMADQAQPAYGTIIVKENFSRDDRDTLQGITVMQRIEGYDAENNDWFWARYTPKGELTHAGQVAFCSDCHFDAGADDFVFLND